MAEKIRVTISASGAHPDLLTVRDAMRQVSDIFELLEDSNAQDGVAWRLSFASTNSPFVAEGEAVSLAPGIDITVVAKNEKADLRRALSDLVHARSPKVWVGTDKARVAARMLARNLNGVGLTKVEFGGTEAPIAINPGIAAQALPLLEPTTNARPTIFEGNHARSERGSVEGYILYVGTHYGEPAIKFRERKSNSEIWCRVSKEIEDQIARQADFADVWNHRRVVIKGTIQYNSDGQITRIFAQSIERISPRRVSSSELRDPDFTSGMRVAEYLDKFREGDLGR